MRPLQKSLRWVCLLGGASALLAGCGNSSVPAPEPNLGSELPRYQDPRCDRYGQIELIGQYTVQNNVWNDEAALQEQCVTALWDGSSSVAGLIVDPVDVSTEELPASYPSIVYGWHFGSFYGPYREARLVTDVAAIPTTWRFTVPGDARYDAAYDLWFHPEPAPPDAQGSLEMMIWVASRDATPVGELVNLIDLGQASFEVWWGQNAGFSTLTYRRTGSVSEVTMDLVPFLADAIGRGVLMSDWYLLSVESGFELWRATSAVTTHAYEVRVE